MIAAVAKRHQPTLLACDADLDRVARVIGIQLDEPHVHRFWAERADLMPRLNTSATLRTRCYPRFAPVAVL